jgi:AraC-like DNA-binding protein
MRRSLAPRIHVFVDPPWSPKAVGGHPKALEICIARRGRAFVGLSRQALSHVPGEYLIVAPSEQHSCWTEKDAAGLVIVHLDETALVELAEEVRVPRPSWPSGIWTTPALLRGALEQLVREHTVGKPDALHRLSLDSLGIQLAIALFRVQLDRDPADRPSAPGKTAGLARAEECMRANLAAPHSLGELARIAGMSPYHFIRSFRRVYGKPPRAYLLGLRVDEAAARMRASDRTLTDIAFDLGFGSSSRLTEAFRKSYGVSPSQWRRALD